MYGELAVCDVVLQVLGIIWKSPAAPEYALVALGFNPDSQVATLIAAAEFAPKTCSIILVTLPLTTPVVCCVVVDWVAGAGCVVVTGALVLGCGTVVVGALDWTLVLWAGCCAAAT